MDFLGKWTCISHDDKGFLWAILSQFTLTVFGWLHQWHILWKVKGNVLYSLYTVTNVCTQEITSRSVNIAGVTEVISKRAGIGLVPPPLTCRTPAVCPLWKHTDVYIPIGWHQWTPVPCFSLKGTLVAHLLSAYISKLSSLYSLLQPGSDMWKFW